MTEKELLKKIKSSAEEIEVPESLLPDSIKKKLDEAVTVNKSEEKKKHWFTGRKIAIAAGMFLVCGAAAAQLFSTGEDEITTKSAEASVSNTSIESAAELNDKKQKTDAGGMYVAAKNYGEVYDVLKASKKSEWDEVRDGVMEGEMYAADGVIEESAEESSAAQTAEAYSKTNIQTDGVDESDIIKTDGEYIYVVDNNAVKIVDIRGAEMKECGQIEVSMQGAADSVIEMYVDGDILNLILQREMTELSEESDTTYLSLGEEVMPLSDVYYMNTNTEVELLTYDISNRSKPELLGSIRQEGAYKTSRRVNDIVYLFTENHMELPDMTKAEAATDEEIEKWIPTINDTAIAAECIYLPKQGGQGLLISSLDVHNPDSIVDNALILNNYVNIYVSTGSVYLYETDYEGNGVSTQIAKFCLDEGMIHAVAAASVAGEIYDTFAINEYQGKLRVLTTDWSGEVMENQLYLFDEKMKVTGSLTGIAKGEEIYAARYMGDMVYFVTYRNTDPLFVVDLSDEKNPQILSELKITGFSEYLHFWGEDKLVGIGYETDSDTGEKKGLKLSMFDISNPTNLTTLGSCVLAYVDDSPALYDYKCVLADSDKNMIGFATESYGRDRKCTYQLYSWKDGKFDNLLLEKLGDAEKLNEYRGIYVGDSFYLANTEQIILYDIEKNYERVQTLKW